MKIGLIREEKIPSDTRVAISPKQCKQILDTYKSVEIFVQSSKSRCFKDDEYRSEKIPVSDDVSHCDILFGVKEVPIDKLISNKTYFFFSHTIKKQSYNKKLLLAILQKQINMIDYECLTNSKGIRVIAFGRWAGIIGAYNGIKAWGLRNKNFELPPLTSLKDFEEAKQQFKRVSLKNVKIVVTGGGRVSHGSCETLDLMKVERVSPETFMNSNFDHAVYTQLDVQHMYQKKDQSTFDIKDYFANPENYVSLFKPYTHTTDIMINGIYWDKRIPVFFTLDEMKKKDFRIKVIADITCDIAPDSSIPSTLKPSTISEPVYGFNPQTNSETAPYQENHIDIMAVDNLPNELPRDASEDFGNQLINEVLSEMFKNESEMLNKAMIAKNGKLNDPFKYLEEWVNS